MQQTNSHICETPTVKFHLLKSTNFIENMFVLNKTKNDFHMFFQKIK